MTHGSPAPLHLVPGEDLADGVRRIFRLELDRLLATVDSTAVDDDGTVHEIRRTAKRLRALLRLVRPGAPDVHGQVNADLRDIARLLADDRDATVLAATVTSLADRADTEAGAALAPVVAMLAGRRHERATGGLSGRLAEARERLATMRWQLAGWALPEGPAADVLVTGHGRTHRQARRRMQRALDQPTVETWHEWRKRVKDDRHQTEYFVAAWPRVLELRADLLHDLSDLLGEDHDLAVLLDEVADLDVQGTATCRELALARRTELQQEARALGTRCYALPTDAHLTQLTAWWQQAAGNP